MSKKLRMPKRAITKVINIINGRHGGSADDILRAADDPVTLVRTIMQGSVANIASIASILTINMEIWRRHAATGHVLPTQVTSGDVAYADDDDLAWIGVFTIRSGDDTASNFAAIDIDMKGNRKMSRSDDLIIRYAGSVSMILDVVVTMFFKEV